MERRYKRKRSGEGEQGSGRRMRGNRMIKIKTEENKKRNILIEGAIMGLTRNLALEKFPGIHKDDPS